ncbi:tryptophan--tRNA ligase [Ruminococcaceae bacterium OttesenSCG-928-A16]|nr:tryptophan--tRNA ligase [Ruminococcaceae bacterium OttesenSCG-928-A16]
MAELETKKRVFSGIQPSGTFTLGNYVGAVRNWAPLQKEFDCIYSVVNMHAITVRQQPAALRRQTYEAAAMLLAAGINPKQSIVFVQSHVPQHTQLSWVLACNTMFGELSRMTQFKDKSQKHTENVNAGLFTYPVLMAADILLYGAHGVPVGEDQKQHVELARNIAQRFNNAYSDTFIVPEPYIQKIGGRIMSLQNPAAKMSKSDENINGFISMQDDADTIVRKFKRAVTDSEARVYRSKEKAGVSNLMDIYAAMTGKTDAEIEAEFEGKGYGDFKLAVAQSVIDVFAPLQQEHARILADKAELERILEDGAQRAQHLANKMLAKVYKKVGFV